MFEGFRYTIAKNHTLMELEKLPGRNPESIRTMRSVAGNRINAEYGAMILKAGFAANKYYAAAAVFARIANSSADMQIGQLNYLDWSDACGLALILGGCAPDDISQVRAELMAATA